MKEAEVGQQIVSFAGEFILGGIALLAIAIAYWTIRELKKAHAEHVSDLKSATEKHIANQAESRDSAAAVVAALEKLTGMVDSQTRALRENTTASNNVRSALDGIKSVVDSVIRDAVRNQRNVVTDKPST